MKKNILTFIFLFSAALILSAPAQAAAVPAKAVSNPVTQTIYFIDNTAGASQIKLYNPLNATLAAGTTIPLDAKSYGLAVWQADTTGGRLLVSTNNGASSKLKYYPLNAGGQPVDRQAPKQELAINALGSSPMGIAITPDGNRAYLADAGNGRVYYFNYDKASDQWSQGGYFETEFNAFDIALSPVQTSGYRMGQLWAPIKSYNIYVSTKANPGKILSYICSNNLLLRSESFVPLGEVSNLVYPTYLRTNFYGTRLYASVNGVSGGDVKVFDIAYTDPGLANMKTVSSIAGAFGWTGFDINITEHYLFLTQPQADLKTTKVYRVPLPLQGDYTVNAATDLAATYTGNGDNVMVRADYRAFGVENSGTGDVKVYYNEDAGGNRLYNHSPSVKNLRQYKMDGTPITVETGYTNEKSVIVKFDLVDEDGDMVLPVVKYHRTYVEQGGTLIPGQYAPAGTTVTMTIPASGSLTDDAYSWGVFAYDPVTYYTNPGNQSPIHTPGVWGAVAFTVDTIPPAAIRDLAARPGSSPGTVNLFWTAVGDNGLVGTAASYIVKYSEAPITADNFDAATTFAQKWKPQPAGRREENKTVDNLPVGKKLYFAVKVQDGYPYTSEISNIIATVVGDGNLTAPTIKDIYPNVVPVGTNTRVTIIGTNFKEDIVVCGYIVRDNGIVNNLDYHYFQDVKRLSDTRLEAVAPDTFPLGRYWVEATTPGGVSQFGANFRVEAKEARPDPAELVRNFKAADGEDSQSTLSWANPLQFLLSRTLSQIIVLRKEVSYPTGHADAGAVKVYDSDNGNAPMPNEAITAVDKGLTNGRIYYYAAFSRTSFGVWNDTVVEGKNADTAAPRVLPAPTVNGLTPNSGVLGQTVTVTINGSNIQDGATIKLTLNGNNIEARVTVANGVATANLVIPANAEKDDWTVIVTNPDGQSSTPLPGGFKITDKPVVITISNLAIVRDGDTPNVSTVSISWQTAPNAHAPVKIYATKSGVFSTNPNDWGQVANPTIKQNGSADTYTADVKVGDGQNKYFKVIDANNADLLAGDLTQDVVGKFDLVLTEGYNFVSIPLIMAVKDLPSVIGTQLTGNIFPPLADQINKFKADKSGFDQAWLNSADNNRWHDPATGNLSAMTIDPDTGYWVFLASGHTSANITIVGSIANASRGPINITSGYNLVGTTYPMAVTIDKSDLQRSGATANVFPLIACRVYSFKADKSGFDQVYLDADNKWHDPNSGQVLNMPLTPGKAYWVQEPNGSNGFAWNYPKPY